MSSTVRKDEIGNGNPKRTSITVLVLGDGESEVSSSLPRLDMEEKLYCILIYTDDKRLHRAILLVKMRWMQSRVEQQNNNNTAGVESRG